MSQAKASTRHRYQASRGSVGVVALEPKTCESAFIWLADTPAGRRLDAQAAAHAVGASPRPGAARPASESADSAAAGAPPPSRACVASPRHGRRRRDRHPFGDAVGACHDAVLCGC